MTCSGVRRPKRCALLIACASIAGFHQRSNSTTRPADGALTPTPPARNDIRSTCGPAAASKLASIASLSVELCSPEYTDVGTDLIRSSSQRKVVTYWEKTITFCSFAAAVSSRTSSASNLQDSPDPGSTLQSCLSLVISANSDVAETGRGPLLNSPTPVPQASSYAPRWASPISSEMSCGSNGGNSGRTSRLRRRKKWGWMLASIFS